MSRNQIHGKRFEDQIKGCGLFDGSADAGRSVHAIFHIEAKFDRSLHLPTSIKATGGKTVALADARKFWSLEGPFRLLVGSYLQRGAIKEFGEIHEFIIGAAELASLRGSATLREVRAIHEGLGLGPFPAGRHAAAREWARQQIDCLKPRLGAVLLNRKIDGRGQRRLQCSVPLAQLVSLTEATKILILNRPPVHGYVLHVDFIGVLALPLRLLSGARERD